MPLIPDDRRRTKDMIRKDRAAWNACLAAVLVAVLVAPLGAKDVFRARMLTGKAPIEPAYVDIQIEIESWTTPEEIRQFQDVLAQGGPDAFLGAFRQSKKGVVRFMYARGYNLTVHMAQALPTDKGKKVVLFLNREPWSQGGYFVRGRHYFMIIELELNEKGKGQGRFYEDAQIKLDSQLGKIGMETYESAPKVFVQASEVVPKAKAAKK
jgi:hypothetical protein